MSVSLDTLPTEIIHSILVYVIETSPRTGRSLSLTNQCLLEAVQVVRSHRRTIRFDKHRKTYEPSNFDSSTFIHTHHLTIEAPELSDPHLFNQTFLVRLLEQIKNLKTLRWNVGPISNDVLSALERFHPRCELRVFRWWRLDGELNHLDEAEVALAKFKNLTHFRHVTISDPSSAATLYESYSWEPFQEIVANSHSLRLASFLSNLIFRGDDAPVWVETTRKTKHKKAKHNTLRSLTIDCPNLSLSSSTLQEIDKFTDLSALEYLKFSRGRAQDYFQVAATLLPNLKHISLNFNNCTDDSILKAASEYLRSCSPVETLSLWGWTSVLSLPDLVTRHGPSLQVLQLHEKEPPIHDSRMALGLSDVKLLMDSCPKLTDITIDLQINDEYKLHSDESAEIIEILEVMADKKPHLQKVQIYFGATALSKMLSGVAALEAETIPPIVEPLVTAIWELLYGKCTSGERLLDVKLGDWETRTWIWVPGCEGRTFCQAAPHERDDRVGQCVIRTRHWSRYNSKGIEL